jgi:hypothetical protein
MRADAGFHADQSGRHICKPNFNLTTRPFLPQDNRAPLVEARDMERVLSDIDAEVQGRAAAAQAGISADFAARITQVRKSLRRDQAARVIEGLRKAMHAAMKFVWESAALETRGVRL